MGPARGIRLVSRLLLCAPRHRSKRQIPAVQATCLRLLRETQRTDLDFQRLEILIGRDISLSFKLLRYATRRSSGGARGPARSAARC